MSYFECPKCSCYHVVGYDGNCEDEAFLDEELDELHGVGGWEEIEVTRDLVPETAPITHRKKNYDRMMRVTEDTDINGNKMKPGCKVRCFYDAAYDAERDWLIGMETVGNCSYFEGELLAIEHHYDNDPLKTGRYYKIALTKSVHPIVNRSHNDFEVTNKMQTAHYRDGRVNPLYYPVNGKGKDSWLFGVVMI